MNAYAVHDPCPNAAARSRAANAVHACFRAWRERALPSASYVIAPAFWTPAGRQRWSNLDATSLRVAKRTEPQLTGLAYTARAIYLVVVAGVATYEQVARLIHCRALRRDDPDYQEHRGKRVSALLICADCSPAVADFARRHRVRVVFPDAGPNPNREAT